MSNINLLVLHEQETFLDRKIKYIEQQRNHLEQLMPIHKQNLAQMQNAQAVPQQQEQPKVIQLPTRKDLKIAKHFEKMAHKITDFSKPLI